MKLDNLRVAHKLWSVILGLLLLILAVAVWSQDRSRQATDDAERLVQKYEDAISTAVRWHGVAELAVTLSMGSLVTTPEDKAALEYVAKTRADARAQGDKINMIKANPDAAAKQAFLENAYRPLDRAVSMAQAIADGDLTQDIRDDRQDEFGMLTSAMSDRVAKLRELVGEVRTGVESVSIASSEIANGNHDLSARTEQTASNLQETAASMDQLTTTVNQSVDTAGLAKRSADAAKEIKALIDVSVQTVESGSRQVAQAGQTMGEIVSSVKRVTALIGQISAASTEQRDGIGQVNQAVANLDQMTQQNAALAEESAVAASALHEQAQRLAEVVSVFNVGHVAVTADLMRSHGHALRLTA